MSWVITVMSMTAVWKSVSYQPDIPERQIVLGGAAILLLVLRGLGFLRSGDVWFRLGYTDWRFGLLIETWCFLTDNKLTVMGRWVCGCLSCEGGSNGHLRREHNISWSWIKLAKNTNKRFKTNVFMYWCCYGMVRPLFLEEGPPRPEVFWRSCGRESCAPISPCRWGNSICIFHSDESLFSETEKTPQCRNKKTWLISGATRG